VSTTWGVHKDVFCPKEETLTFLQNVLSEVAALFPGPYIHIGGDEVLKDRWKESPDAQAVIKREGLKDENELQSYFIRRIERFLNSKGKRTIGWDEILEGGLAPNAVVMSWHGEGGGIEAARQKHEAIMTPYEYCYFDYGQGDPKREPLNIGGLLPLDKVYGYDPLPKELKPDEEKYILGAQANVWTEYIATPDYLEYMVFPRILALSEAVWSPPQERNYEDFRRRLPYHFARLEKQGVNYRVPEPEGLQDFYTATENHAVVQLRSLIPGSQIYYTLDGSIPSEESPRYTAPLQVPLAMDQKVSLNLIVVTPGGRRSVVYGANLSRQSLQDAVDYTANQPGLAYTLYEGKFSSTQEIEKIAPAAEETASAEGTTGSFDLRQFGREVNYGVVFEGYVNVPADGFYKFAVESDDGSVLKIDGEEVVNNDGIHGSQPLAGSIPLKQGFHKIQLRYFQAEGGQSLSVQWAKQGEELRAIDAAEMFH
jgi:hexosaminidase